MSYFRNGNRVDVHPNHGIAVVHLPTGGTGIIHDPIVDLLTGQVYETGEEYTRARMLASAARKSENES